MPSESKPRKSPGRPRSASLVASAPVARLRELVAECGLNQSEVAARVEPPISQGDLSRLLSGGRRVSLDLFDRVRVAVGAKWADLD